MKNIQISAFIYVFFSSCVCAGTIEIKNATDSSIQVFLREHGKEKPYQTAVISKHNNLLLIVDKILLSLKDDQYFYDIIASSSLDSKIEPEWRLLAGECDNLFSGNDTTVIIQEEAGGLKTSCKVIEAHP
jgi:hypothetical protein